MRDQTFQAIIKGMFGWLKKHKPPEKISPVRNPDEYLAEDGIEWATRQANADRANRFKFPNRRARMKAKAQS